MPVRLFLFQKPRLRMNIGSGRNLEFLPPPPHPSFGPKEAATISVSRTGTPIYYAIFGRKNEKCVTLDGLAVCAGLEKQFQRPVFDVKQQ